MVKMPNTLIPHYEIHLKYTLIYFFLSCDLGVGKRLHSEKKKKYILRQKKAKHFLKMLS